MNATTPHAFPALPNAMWPGLVGKGPDSEPPIDLDTMLDLTAAARVDGARFDGVDLFLSLPHTDIDSSDDDLARLAGKLASKGLRAGSLVAPVWPPTGGGSAMGDAAQPPPCPPPPGPPRGAPPPWAIPRSAPASSPRWKKPAASAANCAISKSANTASCASIPPPARPIGPRIPPPAPNASPRPSAKPLPSPTQHRHRATRRSP